MKLDWKEVRIGGIGQVITGHTPSRKEPRYFGGKYPWIKPTDIEKNSRFILKTEENFSDLAYEKYKTALLPRLATCVVTIGTVGEKICLTKAPSFTNQAINAVIPNNSEYDPMFVFYLLKYNLPQVAKRDSGTASGRHNVSKGNFSDITVAVPVSFKTQKRISKTLALFDDLIEINMERIRILEEMAQSLYDEWFVNLQYPGHENFLRSESGLPQGWETKSICKIPYFRFINENIKRFCGEKEYFATANINGTEIIKPGIMYTFEDKPDRAQKQPLVYSVWFARMKETYKVLGFTNVNKDFAENSILSSGFAGFESKREHFAFLHKTINADGFHRLKDVYCTGATQVALTDEGLSKINVVVPTEDLVRRYSEITNPILNQCFILQMQNARLRQTRDLILDPLISGKLDVSGLDVSV